MAALTEATAKISIRGVHPKAPMTTNPASMEGKTLSFIGAFSLNDIENLVVVPVKLEVTD